jgi:hypothetical protein
MKNMKIHSTNYIDTFIEIAEDCPLTISEIPPQKGDSKTAANVQFEMIIHHPYEYTSDDVLFQVYARKNEITPQELAEARSIFFSKGQPCMRCSPLTKRYGWGVHSNPEGKIAIYGCDSEEYQKFKQDARLKKVKAMKSSR